MRHESGGGAAGAAPPPPLFADGHCDTIIKVADDMDAFRDGPDLHLTLDGLRAAGVRAQVFACCVLEWRHPGRAREKGIEYVDAVRRLCSRYPGELVLADRAELLRTSFTDAPAAATSAIIALEGADPLEGDVESMRAFHELGVRLLTLAWDDNEFCGAAFGAGSGLTAKGEELVQLCEELRVLVDVSHASDAGFWDVCKVANRPFLASHSDCRAVCPSPRNLTDEMIRALAERGGVMGINLACPFLSPDFLRASQRVQEAFWDDVRSGRKTFDEAGEEVRRFEASLPRPPIDWILTHVRHAIRVGGEDVVALGGDLDGVDNLPEGIEGVADYPRIAELLLRGGLTSTQVEKICHLNLLRVLTE